jgi:hypothetical protein
MKRTSNISILPTRLVGYNTIHRKLNIEQLKRQEKTPKKPKKNPGNSGSAEG